jgi:hypothetical protein
MNLFSGLTPGAAGSAARLFGRRCGDTLKELIAMMADTKVRDFINANFQAGAVTVKDFPLFPAGKRLIDRKGGEMVVYYDLLMDRVNYVYPDERRVINGEKAVKL